MSNINSEEELLNPDEPISPEQGYSWNKPIAIDRTILMPTSTSKKISVVRPRYEKKVVAVLIQHPKTGEKFYTPEGMPYYNLQEETILTGYETKEIDLPGSEIINVDLTSSYLSEFDVPALRSLISLYSDLQLQILNGKDRIQDLYYVQSKIAGIVNTAKAREGKTARLSKTTISEGTSKQQILDEFESEQKKKSWMPLQR